MVATTLHHAPYSRSFRVLWLMEEIGIEVFEPLTLVHHQIGSREMAQSRLAEISPAVRVPSIEIAGLAMTESGAILQVLAERHAPGLLRDAGHPERPDWLQWMYFAETQASLIEQLNLMQVFLRPPATPGPVVVKLTTARLRQTLAGLEARLGDHDWLLAEGFSLADIMMAFNLFAAPFFVHLDPFPKVRAYKARVEARPAYQRSIAREGPQRFYARDFYPVPEV